MQAIFRDYKSEDYFQCEALVNEAWCLDHHFKPQALADLAKLIYTKGSEISSNYKRVVEIDNKVVGFIFGLNENQEKPKENYAFGLKILFKLLFVKASLPSSKKELLNSFSVHEANRSKLVDRGRSEITLFVVGKN